LTIEEIDALRLTHLRVMHIYESKQ